MSRLSPELYQIDHRPLRVEVLGKSALSLEEDQLVWQRITADISRFMRDSKYPVSRFYDNQEGLNAPIRRCIAVNAHTPDEFLHGLLQYFDRPQALKMVADELPHVRESENFARRYHLRLPFKYVYEAYRINMRGRYGYRPIVGPENLFESCGYDRGLLVQWFRTVSDIDPRHKSEIDQAIVIRGVVAIDLVDKYFFKNGIRFTDGTLPSDYGFPFQYNVNQTQLVLLAQAGDAFDRLITALDPQQHRLLKQLLVDSFLYTPEVQAIFWDHRLADWSEKFPNFSVFQSQWRRLCRENHWRQESDLTQADYFRLKGIISTYQSLLPAKRSTLDQLILWSHVPPGVYGHPNAYLNFLFRRTTSVMRSQRM